MSDSNLPVPVPTTASELVAWTIPPPDRHPAAVYLARLAPGSRRAMRQALDTVAGLLSGGSLDAVAFPWPAVRYQHAQAVRSALAERYAPATANKVLSALRGVLREAWRLGYVDAESYRRAADVEAVKGNTLPAGRALSDGELRALFDVCAEDASPAGARDACLLAVLFGGGLRRSEAVALDVADFDAPTGALAVRHGKGNKARQVYATNGGKRAIEDWLVVRGPAAGPLLCPVAKGGRVKPRRMTAQAVLYRLRDLADRAGVDRFSPHDARRSFITALIDSGADLVVVQHLAGHASVQTTARYDRRGEESKRKAASLIHIPYRGQAGRTEEVRRSDGTNEAGQCNPLAQNGDRARGSR